jgi:hypothetical protein
MIGPRTDHFIAWSQAIYLILDRIGIDSHAGSRYVERLEAATKPRLECGILCFPR